MTRKSLRILLQILLLGLLLGASSTAYADAIAISSVSFNNFQIMPAAGIVLFAPTGASAGAQATNSLGQNNQNMSNALPIAQAAATVVFASASAMANTNNFSANANSLVSVKGCNCQAFSVGSASLSGTFVILGGAGNVNVTISGLLTTFQSVMTDQFGVLAQSDAIFSLELDGVPIFSTASTVAVGANMSAKLMLMEQISAAVTVQFNDPHTISIRVTAGSLGINEIPEPATAVLLMSGLGFVAGFLRKRKKTSTTP